VAEGTQEGLKGSGKGLNPQELTEGDTLKPQQGESGMSVKTSQVLTFRPRVHDSLLDVHRVCERLRSCCCFKLS